MTPMKIKLFCLVFIAYFGFVQAQVSNEIYDKIPVSHQNHPELKSSKHQTQHQESKYELVHLRTQYSKTFLNTNQTQTTIQSSVPLHYKDESDFWLSVDYKITDSKESLSYPSHQPIVKYDKKTQDLSLFNSNEQIKFLKNVDVTFVNNQNQVVKKISSNNVQPIFNEDQILLFQNYLDQIDKQYTFFNQALKSDYILKNKSIFPEHFSYLVVEEILEIPNNFKWVEVVNSDQKVVGINILNAEGSLVFTLHQPIISDAKPIESKFKHLHQAEASFYETTRISDTHLKIRTFVSASYLNAAERVFPISIDPIVTVENTNIVNTCFMPNFQQSTLQVQVPQGQTILFSDIKYDFVALQSSDAWMSEQRSFVTGPNGQTGVLSGSGNNPGTFNYNIPNSEIANGTSNGAINFTFNFARTWGGSNCNAVFQLVNRREVIVTYGTLVFGNGPVFVNEYSASNRSLNDSFGRQEDWIELYNASEDTFFNLTGFHLSNDIQNPTKWQIQNGVIPPNSRVLVFCSERNTSSGTVLHANFNLTQLRPDQIVFADSEGNVLSSHEMFVTQTNHSYGRSTDGANTWRVFNNPTPGASNNGGFQNYTSKPTFGLTPGRYNTPVTISLASAVANEQIRYTTNGATPTINSTLYTNPIVVSATTVIRARAFSPDENILPGFIETNTYFINETSSLPVFSFAGDANLLQLFNGNDALEPIAHFEYFESNGDFVDENLGDFDKHGNDSWSYAQRGVDFVSRDDHGYKRRLEHSFFNTSDRTQFRRLMVKAGASDNYPFENGGAHIRDPFIQTLSQVSGLDLDERSSTSISLFVNGQYWGVYDLRERVDDNNYTDYYYDQDYLFRDSDIYLQFLKTWGATESHFGNQPAINDWQTLRSFVQNNNMAAGANFDLVNNQLNINSLIDYFVINSFVVSRDWLNYNTGWWRGLDPNGDAQKWRYILWDMDAALGHYTNFTGMPDVTATASPCQVENLNVGNGHAQILKKLILENPSVRQKYVTRYADLLNTHFSCTRVTQVFDSIVAVIAPEMPRQIQRWGGNINTWQNNVLTARNFLTTRCAHLMNTGLASCYNLTGPFNTTFNIVPNQAGKIKMNSEWLPNYPFQAQVFGNIETILKAEANPGFVFSHWEVDGAVIQPNQQNIDIVLQLSQATEVIAHFIDPAQTDDDLVYYWHFNNLVTPEDVTSIASDFKVIPAATPILTYTGTGPRDIDVNNNGSILNLHQDEEAGSNARVRNPSENRSLVFNLPTTGYKDIKFTYAVERTNQGQLKNIVSYSLDGVNFIQTGLATTEFDVQTTFSLVSLDFTDIPAVNDNPNFKVQINFLGNTVASNGNNRFDNITLKGVPISFSSPTVSAVKLQVFPNPFENNIQIICNENLQSIAVFDVLGKEIERKLNIQQNHTIIDLKHLKTGIYILKVHVNNGVQTLKIVKN
jgi:hypothetical protein